MSKMDDSRFDDIIKEKVGEYRDPDFDPAALSALHLQMGAATPWPWYSRYRTELLIAAGFALSTLVILWSQQQLDSNQTVMLKKKLIEVDEQQQQIDNLQREISYLRNLPADTIRIIEIREKSSPVNTLLLERIASLEYTIAKLNDEQARMETPAQANSPLSSPFIWTQSPENKYNTFSMRINPRQKDRESVHALPKDQMIFATQSKVQLSVTTIRDLEKHYRRGIGIRIGPTFDISRGFYQQGTGRIDLPAGLLADFILSPSLSVESGGKFIHRLFEVSDNDAANLQLPFASSTLGPVLSADIDSWILEIPANLKYRYPISLKTHWLGGIGYSSLIFTKQVFEYDYAFDGNSQARINEAHTVSKAKVYPGTLNISLGLSHQLKNRKTLETSLYYQHGLGNIGTEKTKANYFGIRSAYWFHVR